MSHKTSKAVDWESVKSKYNDILELMKVKLPSTPEEASTLLKDYTHRTKSQSKH